MVLCDRTDNKMNDTFTGYGRVQVDKGIRLMVPLDFILYYKWLIEKATYNTRRFNIPKYLAHITITSPEIHEGVDWTLAKKYEGLMVEFTYVPTTIYESPKNFWIPVKCPWGDRVKKELGINDGKMFWGFHLTVVNTKNI